jgi:serine/threonine protein kinase
MRFTYQTGAEPLPGYTIQRGIHRGGFGEVYYASSNGGKEVALKLLHREDQDIEIRGVTQCLNLKHPNLVNLFDLKTDSHGDYWVVMEYVAGSSLEDVLQAFPHGLPLVEVRDWLHGLVAGVTYLHERGIVHRDLKPANVYRENGVVKVGDVGLSKRLDGDRRRQNTQSVGTVYYMAPEVANGQYGPEVDVYSLGVMLYELITGKLPFNGETTAEILMKHLTAQPDLSPIPVSLRPMLARALEKDPRKRTPTANKLEQEFLRATSESPSQSYPSNGSAGDVDSAWKGGNGNPFATNPASANGARRPTFDDRSTSSKPRSADYTIFAIILLIVWIPSFYWIAGQHFRNYWILRSWAFAFVAATVIFAFVRSSTTARRKQIEIQWPPPGSTPIPLPLQPVATKRGRIDSHLPVIRPWSEVLPRLANSLGFAAAIASLLSAVIYVSLKRMNQLAVMPGIEHAVFFAATSIVGSWFLLIGHTCAFNSDWKRRSRWLARLASGALIGTSAFALEQVLLVSTPPAAYLTQPAVLALRQHRLIDVDIDPQSNSFDAWRATWRGFGMRQVRLTETGGNPTLLGYVCFFMVWLGIRSWSRDLSPYRAKQFSARTTIVAVAMACLTSLIFAFPQWYAMLWAVTISSTAQLASDWIPKPHTISGGSR